MKAKDLPPALRKGERFKMHEDDREIWEVVLVTGSGACVRPERRVREVVHDRMGEVIAEFEKPAKQLTISAHAFVTRVAA